MSHLNFKRAAALILATAVTGGLATTGLAAPPTTDFTNALLLTTPTMGPPSIDEARELQGAGEWDEAVQAWGAIVEDDPENGTAWFNLGYCLHAGGHLEKAVKVHKKAASFDEYRGIALYNLGCALALLDEPDDALEALTAAQKAGFGLRGQAEGDSDLKSLHDDPRFHELLSGEPARSAGGGNPIDRLMGRLERFMQERGPEIQEAVGKLMQLAYEFLDDLAEDEQLAPIARHLQQMMAGGGGGSGHGHSAAAHAESQPEHAAHAESQPEHAADAKEVHGEHQKKKAAATLAEAQKLQQAGKWIPAAKAYGAIVKAQPDNVAACFGHAYCLHMGGEYKKAIEAHKKAATFDDVRGISSYNLACAYALTDQPDQAFKALAQAHEAGFELAEHVATDPDLKSLRDDPRFERMLKKLKADIW